MKKNIRFRVFETNSSAIHAMTMCSEQDYDAWIAGKLLYNAYERKLVSVEEIKDKDFPYSKDFDILDKTYLTESEFWEREQDYYETFRQSFTTENGETVIAFGYYGHD